MYTISETSKRTEVSPLSGRAGGGGSMGRDQIIPGATRGRVSPASASIARFGVKPAQEGDNRTVQAFRTDCLRESKKIKIAWPKLNYAMAKGVLILWPSKPAVRASATSAGGEALKFSSLAQNRPVTSLAGPPVIRGFASGASESVFHKNPVAGRVFQDETPNFGVKFVDETPNHSCS